MPFEGLKRLSLNELITLLHNSLSNLSKGVEALANSNKQVADEDIAELRDHITSKLQKHSDVFDNARLLKILDLFKEDKKALDVMKDDVEEWIAFLDAIRYNVEKMEKDAGIVELRELDDIKDKIDKLKEALRKE